MNKKKTIAAIVILLISINYYSSGIVALAVQNDGVSKESSELSNNKEPGQYKNTKKIPENNNGQEDKKEIPEDNEQSGMKKLQIPQKMTVVVDPWELDGRGQIYSEQYAVRNTGDVAGIVTISGSICKSSRQDEIVVKSDREGLHENSVKSVYMEMEFSNGDKITLSKEGSTYQAELGPGEKLAIRFLGEVNENTSKGWKDGDITIDAVYSWNVKEESTKTGNASQNILEDTVDESMEGQPGNDVKSEEETKIIDMQIPQSQDIAVDSWKIDENGKIISEQYIIRNAGEQPGTLVLSELVCKPGEQSEIAVQTEKSKLNDNLGKSVYMEMVCKNEKKAVLQQEKEENVKYEIKLNPGEETLIYFAGEINGFPADEPEKGEIIVTATASWISEAFVSEE